MLRPTFALLALSLLSLAPSMKPDAGLRPVVFADDASAPFTSASDAWVLVDASVTPLPTTVVQPTARGTTTIDPGDPATRTQSAVCSLWNDTATRTANVPSASAPSSQCDPGVLPQQTIDAAVLLTNTYRWLAGLPNVVESAEFSRAAQACAALMQVNDEQNHHPPATWTCFNDLAALGARSSNLTNYTPSPAVGLRAWIDDSRDRSNTLGHRRWILYPQLTTIGYGQAQSYACQYVLGPRGTYRCAYVTWPNEGFTPTESMTQLWSFSSASLGVGASTAVTVARDGVAVPVVTTLRRPGYGDATVTWEMPAIAAGSAYAVTVRGLSAAADVTYVVRPVRCAP